MASAGTIIISSNWGAPTTVALTGTTTAQSTTITMASTSGIEVGMQVTGTGSPLSNTTTSVSFTDAGDIVTLSNHGLSTNDEISFVVITTTTGIVVNTIYYVIFVSSSTFQLAATPNGAALPLTTNGSGSSRHRTEVASITPNVSVTMTRPMASSGTNTLAFRQLKTGTALMKNWTVTG